MNEFHFLRPEALFLLLALPLLAWLLLNKRKSSIEWDEVCDPELLPYVVEQQTVSANKFLNIFTWLWPVLIGLPAVIALAGPVWERIPQPVFDETEALVILLDSSRSMDAEDVKPSRYARAKLKVLDLLQQRNTGQTALIAYAAEPFVVSPLTNDAKTIASLVPSLSTDFMPRQGSNIKLATEKALELLNNAGARGNILVISDGVQNKYINPTLDIAGSARARISVIGVGSADGAPIPTRQGFLKDSNNNIVVVKQQISSLKELASQGHYSNLSADDSDLKRTVLGNALLDELADSELQSTEMQADQWREQGPWLLLPVMLFSLVIFRRGLLNLAAIGLALPLLLGGLAYSPNSQAAEWSELEWQDLFRNQDQRAAARFEQKQYEQSAKTFNSPEWKASAQYRAEDYQGAVESLEGIDHPEANYNRGNALAKLGKLKEAISAYKRSLQQNEGHEDAKHNLELLENQQQQDSDQSEQSDKSDESEQSDKQDSEDQSEQNQQDKGNPDQQNSDQQSSEQESDQQESEQQSEQDSDENSEQQDSKEQETEQQEQQSAEQSEEQDESEEQAQDYQQQYQDKSQQEIEQATQQWLRRIPDQPGKLLRNQFENEYRRRQQSGQHNNSEDQPW